MFRFLWITAALSSALLAGAQQPPQAGAGGSAAQSAGNDKTLPVWFDDDPGVTHPELLPPASAVPPRAPCTDTQQAQLKVWVLIDQDGLAHLIAYPKNADSEIALLAKRVLVDDRFHPAKKDGKPVSFAMALQIGMDVCRPTKNDKDHSSQGVRTIGMIGAPTQQPEYLKRDAKIVQTVQPILKATAPLSDLGLSKIGGNVTAPQLISSSDAEFSEEARNAHYGGICVIQTIVDTRGFPVNPRVVRALGMGLDEKALEAVRRYRFIPAKDKGTPVPVMIKIEINFRYFEHEIPGH